MPSLTQEQEESHRCDVSLTSDWNHIRELLKSWLRSQHADSIRERRAGALPQDFELIGTEFHRWVADLPRCEVVVLYEHDVPAVCSNFIARMPPASGYDARFLTYLHAALYALRRNTRHIKQSTGIQNLDSSGYLSEAVGLPPEAEQRTLAAFLDREKCNRG